MIRQTISQGSNLPLSLVCQVYYGYSKESCRENYGTKNHERATGADLYVPGPWRDMVSLLAEEFSDRSQRLMWSQKISNMASIGTANSAPGIPHSQPQKLSPRKMTTGFRVNLRPIMSELTKVPMVIVNPR